MSDSLPTVHKAVLHNGETLPCEPDDIIESEQFRYQGKHNRDELVVWYTAGGGWNE